ncbi:hypothetical protein [uncultured Maribacter sp.]|uniref:hypothetical protein n=1 Tax=uncultured Maribacter sp. TaxID=431308 RepID=UPI002633F00E|nr:hypothetical protein [uncultured Maribacter sp.]
MLQNTFIILTLLTLFLLYRGTGKNKQVVFIIFFWQLIIGFLSFTEVFKNTPLLFPLAIVGTIIITVFCVSKLATEKLNTDYLLGIHMIRIPVELCLYQLFLDAQIPKIMTFSGYNFDILIGISALALVLYRFLKKKDISKRYFKTWNIIGILFLSSIVIIAILSAPLPIQQFAFEQPNIALLEFPYSMLPTCIVPIVFISHIMLLKKL